MRHEKETSVPESASQMDEPAWVDYLEDDLDPSLKQDMELLLKHSAQDRQILQSLKNVKEAVQSIDEAPLPEDGRYYKELHDRIMAEVSQAEIESPKKLRRFKFSRLPGDFMVVGFLVLTASVLSNWQSQSNGIAKPTVVAQIELSQWGFSSVD